MKWFRSRLFFLGASLPSLILPPACFALSMEPADPENSAQALSINLARSKFKNNDFASAIDFCNLALAIDEFPEKAKPTRLRRRF